MFTRLRFNTKLIFLYNYCWFGGLKSHMVLLHARIKCYYHSVTLPYSNILKIMFKHCLIFNLPTLQITCEVKNLH